MSAGRPVRAPHAAWAEHARSALKGAGRSRGGAREAVIGYLAAQDCAVSAQDIHRGLRRRHRVIGVASVYRALEALLALHLLQRLEVGQPEALYEPRLPDGEHHHHIVCDRCERIVPFEDTTLERVINRLARAVDFEIEGHDVVLRGLCPNCRDR